jgi:hypothetical protein
MSAPNALLAADPASSASSANESGESLRTRGERAQENANNNTTGGPATADGQAALFDGVLYALLHLLALSLSFGVLQTWVSYGPSECPRPPTFFV